MRSRGDIWEFGSCLRGAVLALGIALVQGGRAEAAEKPGLDDYLKRLGYEPVAYSYYGENRPLISGMLGDKKVVFLVDTGCNLTTLHESTAARLKTLGELGVTLEDKCLGKLTNASIVLMEKLTLGRAQFFNQPARSANLRMDYRGLTCDGVLGCDFFVRNSCLIACGGQRLYTRGAKASGEQTAALEKTLVQSGWAAVPLRLKQLVCTVEVSVNSQPLQLLVDTGAFVSVLDEPQVKNLGLKLLQRQSTGSYLPQNPSSLVVGAGKIGAHRLQVVELKNVEVGPRKWASVDFGVADLAAWKLQGNDRQGPRVDGLLGTDMLGTHHALLDFCGAKLWLPPEK